MRRSRKPIKIISRQSRLARIQAEMVGLALSRLHPRIAVEYCWVDSEGDQHQSGPLAQRGGKGLFTRTLEQAVVRGDADLAVHSLKDLPARDTPGLNLAAVMNRADVRDCLISCDGSASIESLPQRAVVGTSSPRRAAQVLGLRPDLRIEPMRGNVDTRLQKVLGSSVPVAPPRTAEAEAGRLSGEAAGNAPQRQPHADAPGPMYHATLLAMAGLTRLGVSVPYHPLSLDQVLPAACQGALAIQCRVDDHVTLTRCLPLNDPDAATAVHAERELVAGLGADCDSPVAVLIEPTEPEASPRRQSDAHWFRLRVRVLSNDGRHCIEIDERSRSKDLRRLVKQAVAQLIERGATRLLAQSRGVRPSDTVDLPSSTQQPAVSSSRLGAGGQVDR